MSTLAIIITLLLIFWYFEAGSSVRQMVEDVTGKPVRPIIKKVKKRDRN